MRNKPVRSTDRPARLPWQLYAGGYLLLLGITGTKDLENNVGGAARVVGIIGMILVLAVAYTFLDKRTARDLLRPGSRLDRRVLTGVAVVWVAGFWLAWQYGRSLGQLLASATGLTAIPYTLTGIVFGAIFVALIAVSYRVIVTTAR